MKTIICPRCGETKQVKNPKARFCSVSCSKKLEGHHNWKGGRCTSNGYVIVATGEAKDVPRKHEHVVIAERALGHPLPPRAEVHHFDENRSNNAPSNLVICNDKGYHRILHIRQARVREGIDPRIEKRCRVCLEIKPLSQFHRNKLSGDGLNSSCKPCNCRAVATYLRG